MTRRAATIALAGTFGGLVMLAGSLLFARQTGVGWASNWWSGVLVEAGASVLLFVPLYVLTRTMDRHIEAVREETVASVEQVRADTASTVDALTDRVSSFEGDVERRLADIVTSVDERLDQERFREAVVRDAVRKAPTRAGVLEALRTGQARGWISDGRPPRVVASNPWGLLVGFRREDGQYVGMPPELMLTVENMHGNVIEWIPWEEGDSASDVMVSVAQAVETASGDRLDVAGLFTGLADLLEVASTDPARRPIVQLCPPLWAVTTYGVVTYGKDSKGWEMPPYENDHRRLRSERIGMDMEEKTWSNPESFGRAQAAALALFPEPDPNAPPF